MRAAIAASGDRYLSRVLGDDELAEGRSLWNPDLVARNTNGRFAAKEAVY